MTEQTPQEPIIDCTSALEERLAYFNELEAQYKTTIASKSAPIKVTYKTHTFDAQSYITTPQDLIAKLAELGEVTRENPVYVAMIDNKPWDLFRPFEQDCTFTLHGFDSEEANEVFWHSSAHLLGQAMETLYKCYLHTGPATKIDFFYDCKMNGAAATSDFKKIQSLMESYVRERQAFSRIEITKEQALKMFAYNPYKVAIINKLPEGELITAYKNGKFVDLCRGPHLPNAGCIKAIKMLTAGSVHLDGTSTGEVLQRVHAISFPNKDLLKEYVKRAEEAEKRDHRVIGKQQDLFFFHVLSPGSCFWLPHGTRIYNKLVDMIKTEYRQLGYQEVITPNIYLSALWETSGHWQHYKDDMFVFDCEKQTFALKPMNCPGHCVMFASKGRSYRELPLRYAEFGVLHRNELTGALHGLTRVRRFVQDDSHIFCTMDQIDQEVNGVLSFMKKVYDIFGFTIHVALSTRNEKKYVGDLETWNRAEAMLTKVLENSGLGFRINPGDGAFYGPKIDIRIEDALGRKHQLATIQLDFQLPIRFKLEYMSDDTEKPLKTPVMVHRAILGSVERFTAILTEHLAGKWPFWLSPRQVMICTVSEKFNEYAESVQKKLFDAGFYVDLDDSDNKLPKKVRTAQLAQYNFILVIGEEEMQSNSVNVRTRENKVEGKVTVDEFVERLKQLDAEKK